MFGQSAKCRAEKHEQYIAILEEREGKLLRIVVSYLRKYGPINKR